MNVVVQTSFVGDAILTLPFLSELMRLSKERLLLVVAPRNQALFNLALEQGLKEYSTRIELVIWDKRGKDKGLKGILALSKLLRSKAKINYVYCIQRSFRTGLLANLLFAKKVIGFSSGAASFFYTDAVPRSWDLGVHEIQKNLNLLKVVYGEGVFWNLKAASLLKNSSATMKNEHPVISLSLGSPWPTKRWDGAQALQLCKQLLKEGWTVRLLGDSVSSSLYKEIRETLKSPLLEDYSGKSSITEWIDLIATSDVVVSGDSAAVHVASDLDRPVVALFGPTIPELGFSPWRVNAHAIGLDMKCRPCDIHGPKQCPLGHHDCMKLLSAELVLKRVKSCLDGETQKD